MNFFLKLFGSRKSNSLLNTDKPIRSEECEKLLQFERSVSQLLSEKRYIAKSDYMMFMNQFKECYEQFVILKSNDVLSEYCAKNSIEADLVNTVMELYKTIEETIENHNEQYISFALENEKEYLDSLLYDVDPQIILDQDQRRVILTEEDYCLVIAGAGAGKTTTIAGKVRYLTEKRNIDPKQILVISFTNKAVDELKEKINKQLGIECPITTFHAAGNAILRKQSPNPLNIAEQSKLYYVTLDFFRNSVMKNESLVNNLILFFGSYFDAPYEGKDLNIFFNKVAKSNFSTMKSDLEEYSQTIRDIRTKKLVTISNEYLRSFEEVEIANYLYMNNIDYQYEPLYQYNIEYARKPYTPDFIISQGEKKAYIEHFGITEDGKNDRYSKEQLETYKKAVNHKISLHREHGTTLIYTFSKYKDGRPLLEHLRELLLDHGFELRPRSSREILEKLIATEENRYIRKLVNLICRFISNFKTNGYTQDDFARMYHSTTNVRSKLFLNICESCYLEYQRYLAVNNAVDFEDMINESARILREVKEMKQILDFKYIIVDEYQDISRQRFDLTKALSEVTKAKIIAVGDDWQSIYAFSGSDVELFTKFTEKMGYGKLLKIVQTYRNSQEVIDIAGNFIQKNDKQIKKMLRSPKQIEDPVIIYTYDNTRKKLNDTNKSGANYAMAHAVEVALEQIISYNRVERKEPETGKILLLGRFGFDGDALEKSGLFEFIRRGSKLKSVKYPELDITFMTAHSSKGLGYDNVIVVNGKNETYGFPSKIEDDPVLAFVIKGDRSIDYAEERRLFYVAMTRTKNRVYFIAPEQNPSEFLLEIKHDFKNVVLKGNWNENPAQYSGVKNTCPVCGYPLHLRYKNAYGLRMYICTNEPEICGFLSNDLRGGKMSILKCGKCTDGYLVVRWNKKDESKAFLGCTNYFNDGKGCGNVMSKKAYYNLFGLEEETEESITEKVTHQKAEPAKIKAGKKNPSKEYTAVAEKKAEAVPVETQRLGSKFSKVEFMLGGISIYDVINTILECVDEVSGVKYYGITVTVDILKGNYSDKVKKNRLNLLKSYGTLAAAKREDIITVIEWMIEYHYLLKTTGNYPVLHPTSDGRKFRENIRPVQIEVLKSRVADGSL